MSIEEFDFVQTVRDALDHMTHDELAASITSLEGGTHSGDDIWRWSTGDFLPFDCDRMRGMVELAFNAFIEKKRSTPCAIKTLPLVRSSGDWSY